MSDAAATRAKTVLPDDVLPALERLCRQFHIRSLTLFGSANTPAFDPARSDIDFLVDYEDGADRGFDAFFALKGAMEALFGRPVDLLTRAQIVNPYVLRAVERNHRQIIPRLSPDEETPNKGGVTLPTDRTAGRLWDVSRAIDEVLGFVAGSSHAEFQADAKLRKATYFQLTIMGEALARLRDGDPATAARIPDLAGVIGMRNILVHEYGTIDDDKVWQAATVRAPELKRVVDALLQERAAPEP